MPEQTMTSTQSSQEEVQKLIEITSNWSRDIHTTVGEFLYDTIENPEEAIKVLTACNCCERHQLNRPNTLDIWYDTPFSNVQTSEKCGNCTCSCRHLSRFICRAFAKK